MIMKSINKKVLIPICILFLTVLTFISLLARPLPSKAMGTVDIFMDSSTWIPVGDTFVLTVRVETDIEAMVNLEISYNGDNLECLGAYAPNDTGAICNDNGSLIMIATLSFKTSHKYECTFKVKKEAATTFKATVIECGTLDALELPTPSLEKTVNGYLPTPTPTQAPTPTPTVTPTNAPTATQNKTQAPTQAPTPTQSPSYTPFNPTADPSATPSNPYEFMDNDVMRYVADNFEEGAVTMPEGFEKRSVKYMGSNIFGAQNSFGVNLVYTTDILGQNGKFYICTENKNSLLPYTEIPYVNNNYVFMTIAETPSYLQEKEFDLAENKIPAYTTTNETYKDFIILYGFKVGGGLSYYLYDTVEGTLQRCVDHTILNDSHENCNGGNNDINETTPPSQPTIKNTTIPATSPLDNKYNFALDKNTVLLSIIAVCVIAVILAIIVIIVRSKKISNRNFFDEEYYNVEENISKESVTEETPENSTDESEISNEDLSSINIDINDVDDDEILQLGND